MNNENDFFKNNENNKPNNLETPILKEEKETNKIEIPQAYYDQIKEEEQRKEQQAKQAEMDKIKQQENSKESGKLLLTVIVFAILTYLLINFTINKSEYFSVVMLGIIIMTSIGFAFKDKDKTNTPDGILVGGILSAVISFAISMLNKDETELWTYYSVASGVVAILGYIISKIITSFVVNSKNIKALQTIGMFLILIAIVGVPIYFKQKNPEEFYKVFLHRKSEIVAESEEEFIIKTLKNRYGKDFTCGNKKTAMNYVDNTMVTRYMCIDKSISQETFEKEVKNISYEGEESNKYINIVSTPYNEADNKYIIEANYIDNLYLNSIKDTISTALKKELPTSAFKTSLYPNGNCLFVGDCADCEEYFAIHDEEKTMDNRYKVSSTIDYSKDMNLKPIEFINKHEYKYIINISGHYALSSYEELKGVVASALKALNSTGLENNFGYEIIIKSSTEYNKVVHHVVGKSSNDKTFKDPVDQEL